MRAALAGTRRVQLVRRDGRDASTLYGRGGGAPTVLQRERLPKFRLRRAPRGVLTVPPPALQHLSLQAPGENKLKETN